MTVTPRQCQRVAAKRLGREAILRRLATAEAAVVQTADNPYGVLDRGTIQRERRRLERLARSLPFDMHRAFRDGLAEGVREYQKPRRSGRLPPFGALTEHRILQKMHELVVGEGMGVEKAALVVATGLAEVRRASGAGPAVKAPAIRALWSRRNPR